MPLADTWSAFDPAADCDVTGKVVLVDLSGCRATPPPRGRLNGVPGLRFLFLAAAVALAGCQAAAPPPPTGTPGAGRRSGAATPGTSVSAPSATAPTTRQRTPTGQPPTGQAPAHLTPLPGATGAPVRWVRPALPALAYAIQAGTAATPSPTDGVWLLGHGQQPRKVGTANAYRPVWTLDNAYLAWITHDGHVVVLDAHTGAEQTMTAPASRQLLPASFGYAAIPDDLVGPGLQESSTDLSLLDLRRGLKAATVRRLATTLPRHREIDWTQSLGYELVAASYQPGVGPYAFDGVAYAVGFDGRARELFRNFSNVGWADLTISPDSRQAAGFVGERAYGSVCGNAHTATIGTAASGPIARLAGLPPQANGEQAPEYGDLTWSGNGDLFVTLAQFVLDAPVGSPPASCRAHRRPTRLFRCPGGRACVPLPLSARATTELRPVFSADATHRAFSVAHAGDGTLAVSVGGDGHTPPAVLMVPPNGPALTLAAATCPTWSS